MDCGGVVLSGSGPDRVRGGVVMPSAASRPSMSCMKVSIQSDNTSNIISSSPLTRIVVCENHKRSFSFMSRSISLNKFPFEWFTKDTSKCPHLKSSTAHTFCHKGWRPCLCNTSNAALELVCPEGCQLFSRGQARLNTFQGSRLLCMPVSLS